MSTPDTSLFFKFPQIDRQQQDLAIAQKQALIAEQKARTEDQLAQAEYRTREADKLREQNEETRKTYNAQEGARAYIQDAHDRGLPTPSMDELIGRFGNYAMPFLTAMTARDKEDLANRKEQSDNYLKLHGAMIDALSLDPDESKHPEIERTVYQRALQAGWITQAQANQFLQSPPDKLDQLEAGRKAEQRKNDELKAASERNFKDAESLKNAAQTAQANAAAEKDQYGVSKPFPPEVEAQKIRMEKPPTPSNEDKELADFIKRRETDPKLKPYAADRTGLYEWKKAQEASQGEAAVQLSPAGLDVAADMFAK